MKIKWLSNGLYSLKNCHKQFGQAFRPHPPFWAMPKFTCFFLGGFGSSLSKIREWFIFTEELPQTIWARVSTPIYRTQVSLVRSMGPSLSHWLRDVCADLTDVTLADEDTNSILTDNANRPIQGNVAMQWCNLVANFWTNASNASGAIWWANLLLMKVVICCCEI